MNTHARNPLDLIDDLLAEHRPFGDSAYVREQLHARYRHRLEKIAAELPVAGDMLRALEIADPHTQYRTLGDPVLRHVIQQSLRHIVRRTEDGLPFDECESVLRATVRHLEERLGGSPAESGNGATNRLGDEPHHGWIWSEEHADDVFGRVFRRMVNDNFRGEPLCSPSAADLENLEHGVALLGMVLPLCSRSALSHAHVVVVVPNVGAWTQAGSCSEFVLSGMIFMNREMLGNPWWVAEHLLHEALHQKLYDLRHSHSLLTRDLSPNLGSSPKVEVHSIWNAARAPGSNLWDTFRAVAAFHVYVHLAIFALQAERRRGKLVARFGSADDGRLPAVTTKREAIERAHYLGEQLKEKCWEELGPAGRLLVDWLRTILRAIDPSPPPSESPYLRLLLNRYLTEATIVASKPGSSELARRTEEIIITETATVRLVVQALEAGDGVLAQLSEAAERGHNEAAQAAFSRFRSGVARTLLSLSPDGYGLRRSPSTDSLALEKKIRAMMEASSQQLASILGASA